MLCAVARSSRRGSGWSLSLPRSPPPPTPPPPLLLHPSIPSCDALLYNLLQLTSGEWVVEEVKAVDEAAGLVYFLGTK